MRHNLERVMLLCGNTYICIAFSLALFSNFIHSLRSFLWFNFSISLRAFFGLILGLIFHLVFSGCILNLLCGLILDPVFFCLILGLVLYAVAILLGRFYTIFLASFFAFISQAWISVPFSITWLPFVILTSLKM